MRNILLEELSIDDLTSVFKAAPRTPLLPSLGDSAWRRVAANPIAQPWLAAIRTRALAEAAEPMPVLTDELYALFCKNGNRLEFESVYFERRRRLARAAIATLVESDPAARAVLQKSLLIKIQDVFAEEAWCFPAHVSENPTGKGPMKIDLFGAETANLFGELLTLFPALIPADLQTAIKQRLHTQFFQNYLDNPPGWTTFGMNWNAVCHQGVMGAALAVVDDPALLGRLFHSTARATRIFFSGFCPDGGSSEGPGYWGYGFGWLAILNEQLETRTQKQLSFFHNHPHAHAIARFGPTMTLANGFAINFSDNNPRSAPRPALLHILATRFDDNFIAAHATLAWQRAAVAPLDIDQQRVDLFFLARHLLNCPTTLGAPAELPNTDVLLPDLAVLISRFRDAKNHLWEFAAKAGNNYEHHNHNDVGSYILNLDGLRLLTEIGAPEYNRDFFGKKRYTFIATRSLGHPVPLINNLEQPEGKQFRGTITAHTLTPTSITLTLDLTPAYSPEALCTSCLRTFHLNKTAGTITITDHIQTSSPVPIETAVITESPATQHANTATITNGPVTLRLTPAIQTTLAEIQRHDFSDHSGHPSHIHRLVLRPTIPSTNVTLTYTIDIPT